MYAVPDVDEVVAVAKELGIHLSADEAVLYRKHLMEQLGQLDAFVQARIEEPRPPMVSAGRKPGWRPSAEEDPLNAWMWKCRIEGAADGLLKGKTFSFKDHIAIAGMPMSFGSFALDGFIPDFDATVVTRVLEAGGTITGKNVMNGLSGGFGTGGAIGDYGRPLNPHNREHVTGGSSSGSGAAVLELEVYRLRFLLNCCAAGAFVRGCHRRNPGTSGHHNRGCCGLGTIAESDAAVSVADCVRIV